MFEQKYDVVDHGIIRVNPICSGRTNKMYYLEILFCPPNEDFSIVLASACEVFIDSLIK